jgi:hypothetical protein
MQMREFSRFLREHIRKAFRIQSGDNEINPQFTETMETSAGSENEKHLFEICHFRNRFDPALSEVPGGYLAFELQWSSETLTSRALHHQPIKMSRS